MIQNLEWLTRFMQEHTAWLLGLAVFSLISLLIWLITSYFVLARLPVDYFSHPQHRQSLWQDYSPALRIGLMLLKNLLGVIMLILGVVQLFIPGQGLLTMLVGCLLVDFPGKYALECWLVRRPGIRRAINHLRQRANQPPFLQEVLPEAPQNPATRDSE